MIANISAFPEGDARAGRRRVVNFAATVKDAEAAVRRVYVTDLSEEGCKLGEAEALQAGLEVWLKFTGKLPLKAVIKWVRDADAGCEFVRPLHELELAEMLEPTRLVRKRLFTAPQPSRR